MNDCKPCTPNAFAKPCPPLVKHVASFVSYAADLVALQRVCKAWREPCDRNVDWHRIAFERFPRLASIAMALNLDLEASGATRAFREQLALQMPKAPPPKPPPRPPSFEDFAFTFELYRTEPAGEHPQSWTGALEWKGVSLVSSMRAGAGRCGEPFDFGVRVLVSRVMPGGLRTINLYHAAPIYEGPDSADEDQDHHPRFCWDRERVSIIEESSGVARELQLGRGVTLAPFVDIRKRMCLTFEIGEWDPDEDDFLYREFEEDADFVKLSSKAVLVLLDRLLPWN